MRMLMAAVLVCAGLGCADDGGGNGGDGQPVISDLSYTPEVISVGVATSVNATVSFTDAEGDVKTLKAVLRQQGQSFPVPDTGIAGVDGLTAGQVTVALQMNTNMAGEVAFDIWLVDAAGHESNKLTGTVTAQ